MSFFLCKGSHWVVECLKCGKLAAFVIEEERQEVEKKILLMSLLSVIQTKGREQFNGRMYVETEVRDKKLQTTFDIEADIVYMEKELADKIGLPYKKEKGYIKRLNVKSLSIYGVVLGADIKIGPLRGKFDITVTPLGQRKNSIKEWTFSI